MRRIIPRIWRRYHAITAAGRFALFILLMTLAAPAVRAQPSGAFDIDSVQLTNFQVVANVLAAEGTVTGTVAGLPFVTPADFFLQLVPDNPATPGVECALLHLELDPIQSSLLGLHVDTSPICLEITAIDGGGLLGDLLCDLAGGGIGGLGIPLLPTAPQVTLLQGALVDLLDAALDQDLSAPQDDESDAVCTGECDILHRVLGPVDLSLLGLIVHLDDCADAPVDLCVSASADDGALGDILCRRSSKKEFDLTLAEVVQVAERALALTADGNLSIHDRNELKSLVNKLRK